MKLAMSPGEFSPLEIEPSAPVIGQMRRVTRTSSQIYVGTNDGWRDIPPYFAARMYASQALLDEGFTLNEIESILDTIEQGPPTK